jgi:hypothetical protein
LKLKLYTDQSFLPPGKKCISLLFPFWGNPETDRNDADFGRFDEYTAKGKEIFDLVEDPSAADFLVLPYEFSFLPEDLPFSSRMEELAVKHGRKVLVFFNSDSTQEIPMKQAVIFRTSFYKSLQKANEYALPGWSADFMKAEAAVQFPGKPEKPCISYCGYVDYLSLAEKFRLESIIKNVKDRSGSVDRIGPALRGKAVRALLKDGRINKNFIIRKGFWAPEMDKQQARNEYIKNIFSSEYALVARGAGNFSYRLYEVLSCGRIPVFINTDSVLPFDQVIDWKKYTVWIEEGEIGSIAEKLCTFHRDLSGGEFMQLAKACRKLYEEWLSPLGYYQNIHKYLN